MPPIVENLIVGDSVKWRRAAVDYDLITRVLTYHLVLEHYIDQYLEVETYLLHLRWDRARLTFNQKLEILSDSKSPVSKRVFLPGLRKLNSLRNHIAHSLDATFEREDLAPFLTYLRRYEEYRHGERELSDESDPKLVMEHFTFAVAAWFAGFLSARAAGR